MKRWFDCCDAAYLVGYETFYDLEGQIDLLRSSCDNSARRRYQRLLQGRTRFGARGDEAIQGYGDHSCHAEFRIRDADAEESAALIGRRSYEDVFRMTQLLRKGIGSSECVHEHVRFPVDLEAGKTTMWWGDTHLGA